MQQFDTYIATIKKRILGADFVDWICGSADVNEAFKFDEVADLHVNLASDLPTRSNTKKPAN